MPDRVPTQGSMLGALVFSIYVSDLPAVSETCSSTCYVHDTKLILSFTVEESHAAADKINDDLQRIRDCCFENYRKIPKISPGAYSFQRPFLRGLFLEGLIFGGAYLRREICVSKSIELVL